MMHALSFPLAVLVTLSLGPGSASARLDRLPSHNMGKRAGAGAADHHLMAGHLLHRRNAVTDAIAAISGALDTADSTDDSVFASAAQQAAHKAELGSALVLVSSASATSESAKKEGDEEKAKAAAAKKARAKLARLAHSSSVASIKKASSIKKSKSSKSAAKLKSARNSSLSSSRVAASKSKSKSASLATSSKAHASSVKAASVAKASAAKSKSKAAASKLKAEAKTTAVAKVAKVANASKSGTVLAAVNVKGLKNFVATNTCGSSGATDDFPNGAEDWLNCGISEVNVNSGWTPPGGVTIDKIAYVSLEDAMSQNSVWAPCKPYISLFEKWGAATGLPPILLASFAMQESTCNADESGDSGGAFGLMQITLDKCEGRDTAGCNEPDFNIETGAKYFASQLVAYDGNILLALGQYNGWFAGLSYSTATAAASTGCCECQQNLDYMHQMLNGWLQGKTGYELGSIGNLDVCGN